MVTIVAALLFCPVTNGQDWQRSACIAEFGKLVSSSSCRVLRTIEDPATRQHWLLVRDLDRTTAPALLVLIPAGVSTSIGRSKLQTTLTVIRPGERVVVSEKTAVSEARFDATALSAAAIGDDLVVRLRLGGSILHARATAPGCATLVTERSEAKE